ncbi:DUF445 domain-containing protein [Domibacillus iocasae]|nr:DUF445 family protein [Domibacillus iocasae]
MSIFWLILFMGVIGAVIGGVTNALAIRMLFRPHNALYIGSWRIPFTPGLIPKRKSELARQIGKIVDEHLLTPESIEKKLKEPELRGEIEAVLQSEAKKWIRSNMTIADILQKVHFPNAVTQMEERLNGWIDQKYAVIKDFYIDQTVKESLPAEWLDKAEEKIPDISAYILTKGTDYFSSEEGRYRIKRMTDDFLAGWGKFGSMIQTVVGNTSLADKIRPEIIKFLTSPGTKDLLDTMLKNEWDKVIEWKWTDVLEQLSDEKAIQKAKKFIGGQLDLETVLNEPVSAYAAPFEQKIKDTLIPELTDKGITKMAKRIPSMMGKLKIADIVRQQIEAFSTERLEMIVLAITHRELKMITLLGALLGGLIGILQAVIMMAFPV